MSWIIWVVIAVVVIAVLAAVILAGGKKKKERNREHAGELRDQAAARAPELKKTEAHARETEAQAAAARAEADRKQAEADRLEAEATNRHQSAAAIRDEHQDHLRKADELDPDVNTRSDDYTGPESHDRSSESRSSTAATGATTNEDGEPSTITHADGSTEQVGHDQTTDSTDTDSNDTDDRDSRRRPDQGSDANGSHRS